MADDPDFSRTIGNRMNGTINAAFQPTRDMMRETARSALSPLRELLEVPVLLTPFALEKSPAVRPAMAFVN